MTVSCGVFGLFAMLGVLPLLFLDRDERGRALKVLRRAAVIVMDEKEGR